MAIRAVLVDIDGVLTVSWRPVPGAAEALGDLLARGLRIALVTNTTSRTRGWIAARLAGCGFEVSADDILSAPALARDHLAAHHPGRRCLLLNSGDIAEDLPGVDLVAGEDSEHGADGTGSAADVVLLGGAGPEFSYGALNDAFRQVRRGAALLTMNRNLFWATDDGLQLDTGAFLAGLEAACGRPAVDLGKPAPAFFAAALDRVGAAAAETVMVGDDVRSDVIAAQAVGIRGVLVRTGKYLLETLAAADPPPDQVIDSFADLPALLDRLPA
jgi:HAD superfamily hydrolase (TIGR01458 family)